MPYSFQTQKKKIPRALNRRYALTPTQRREIRELHRAGLSQRKLALRYAVDRGTIKAVLFPRWYAEKKRATKVRLAINDRYYKKERHAAYMRTHRRYKQTIKDKLI